MQKILFALAITLTLVACQNSVKTGWIDGQKVYDEYHLTKERQESFIKQRDSKRMVLDSLKNSIIAIENELRVQDNPKKERVEKYQNLVQVFRQQQEEFELENEKISNEYKTEILKKISETIEEYGKDHGYKYIFGDWESGSIMYADDADDLTQTFIDHLNGK